MKLGFCCVCEPFDVKGDIGVFLSDLISHFTSYSNVFCELIC